MTAGAVLVWSNALGDGAPFFVPVEVLTGVLTAATGRGWDAVHSQAQLGQLGRAPPRLIHPVAASNRTHDDDRQRHADGQLITERSRALSGPTRYRRFSTAQGPALHAWRSHADLSATG
jgi:hypothetical protein